MRLPFLRTIKAKMASVVIFIIAILALLVLLLSIGLHQNFRTHLISETRSFLLSEKEHTDKDILRLENNVLELAMVGELLFQAARDNDFDAIGRRAVVRNFQINTLAIGGGIWFKPWSIYPDRELVAFYAYNDDGIVRYDPRFESDKYHYPTQAWYAAVRNQIAASGRSVAWTPPYYDETGSEAFMTTAGCLIRDEAGDIIGMATVDWPLGDISKKISAIRPTPGSFVLFADVQNDFILANSDVNNREAFPGQSLASVPWFKKDAPGMETLDYLGKSYYSYRIAFDNGMVLVVNIPVAELEKDINHALMRLVVVLVCFGVLLAAVIQFMLTRFINRPVAYLMKKAGDIGSGNLDVTIDLPSGDELGELALTLGTMAEDLKPRVHELRTVTAEKERIGAELDIAREIQASMLPSIFPPYPDRTEFDIYASMIPAKEVGGDFYDFFMIDDNRVAVVIADVSGKGVPAALFMVVTKTLIRNHAQMDLPVAEVFNRVNMQLCENNQVGMFVTAFMGILDVRTGEFEYVNAGHNPPLLFSDDATGFLPIKPGFILGGVKEFCYTSGQTKIHPGDCIFLYTDGITEAENASGTAFGTARLMKTALVWRQQGQSHLDELLTCIKRSVDEFAAGTPQFDDITMLGLAYFGSGTVQQTIVPAKEESLPGILEILDTVLEKTSCAAKTRIQLQLAVEEMFVNIVRYAFPDSVGQVTFEVGIEKTPSRLVLRFIDSGIPFNPMEREEPDVTLSPEERQVGGLGIFLAAKNVDHMEYEYKDGCNILTMTKDL